MDNLIKILVVGGDSTLAAKISLQLTGMGYEVTGTISRGEDVMLHVQEKNRISFLIANF